MSPASQGQDRLHLPLQFKTTSVNYYDQQEEPQSGI